MYSLSPSLWPRRLPFRCVVEYIRQLGVRQVTSLTRVVLFFVVCGLKRDLCCCFFLLAVFYRASAFNQNVSTWNTGAVTTMQWSKCTLSPSLLATAPSVVVLWCVVEYIRHLEVRRVTKVSHVVVLSFLVVV